MDRYLLLVPRPRRACIALWPGRATRVSFLPFSPRSPLSPVSPRSPFGPKDRLYPRVLWHRYPLLAPEHLCTCFTTLPLWPGCTCLTFRPCTPCGPGSPLSPFGPLAFLPVFWPPLHWLQRLQHASVFRCHRFQLSEGFRIIWRILKVIRNLFSVPGAESAFTRMSPSMTAYALLCSGSHGTAPVQHHTVAACLPRLPVCHRGDNHRSVVRRAFSSIVHPGTGFPARPSAHQIF